MVNPTPIIDSNMTGIIPFLKEVSDLTTVGSTSLLGMGILIIIGFVSFLSTKAYSSDKAFGFSAFLTLICAILLRFMELINDAVLIVTIVLFIGSVIFLMRERQVEEFGV